MSGLVLFFGDAGGQRDARMEPLRCYADQAQFVEVPLTDVSLERCATICREAPGCKFLTYEPADLRSAATCTLIGSVVPSDQVFCTKQPWTDDIEPSFTIN